jgi:hypothetical protein
LEALSRVVTGRLYSGAVAIDLDASSPIQRPSDRVARVRAALDAAHPSDEAEWLGMVRVPLEEAEGRFTVANHVLDSATSLQWTPSASWAGRPSCSSAPCAAISSVALRRSKEAVADDPIVQAVAVPESPKYSDLYPLLRQVVVALPQSIPFA